MEQKNQMGALLTVFIMIVVGLALLQGIADPISEYDDILFSHNETITFVANTTTLTNTALITNGIAGSVITTDTILSGNGVTDQAFSPENPNWSIGTNNYVVTSAGVITLDGDGGNFSGSETLNLTYSSYSDTYVGNGTSRSLISLAILFFVLALFAGLIYWIKGFEWIKGKF